MLNKKHYTVTDISKKYGIRRANIYYYMDKHSEHLSNNKTKSIDRDGLIKLLKDLNIEVDENLEPKHNNTKLNDENNPLDAVLIENYENMLKFKDEEIKRLSDILDKQMELNRNNQILLRNSLEKIEKLEERKEQSKEQYKTNKQSFFKRVFNIKS